MSSLLIVFWMTIGWMVSFPRTSARLLISTLPTTIGVAPFQSVVVRVPVGLAPAPALCSAAPISPLILSYNHFVTKVRPALLLLKGILFGHQLQLPLVPLVRVRSSRSITIWPLSGAMLCSSRDKKGAQFTNELYSLWSLIKWYEADWTRCLRALLDFWSLNRKLEKKWKTKTVESWYRMAASPAILNAAIPLAPPLIPSLA